MTKFNPIMETFNMTYTQWGMINTGALIVGSILYPVWGWLNDKYNRARLLALASLVWGSTTWLSSVVRTFPAFLVTRSSTGIDDSSYPGMYSLIADYFSPKQRGKVYGILQLSQPIGYLLGMVLALLLAGAIGWRNVFIATGSLGIILAFVIYFGIKDVPRGSGEEELQGVETSKYKFNWKTALTIFKKKSLLLVFLQGFFGVFPWNVITYWIFDYLKTERAYNDTQTMLTMVPAVLILAVGYPLGGALGDRLFKKTPKGRIIVGAAGVAIGAVLLWITMNIPMGNPLLFGIFLCATALFIPIASPNVLSSFYDVTEPEIRSTTNAVQSFVETIGSALAPLLAGIIADRSSLGNAILVICTGAWVLCFAFFIFAARYIPKDIEDLRKKLAARAAQT